MVRVRFAPSPTGLLHLGGARTALFNYLFASANRGQCILRIEDTDQDRLVPGSRERLEEALKWLGIEFHESPSKGGPYGPYIQSDRLTIYQRYAGDLLQSGNGYPCFCSKERLHSLRELQNGYDGRCRLLSQRQANKEINRGTPFTIRLKAPRDEVLVIDDVVYGRVEVGSSAIDDQILLKTDGFPTYHLACVVDDHCMEISHVLRGEEWLLSTAKHGLLYKSLGWSLPVFAHLPLLVSSSGEKLSKRRHGTSVQSYRERGFLAEAVSEFLSRLGWSGGGGNSGGGQCEGGGLSRSLEDMAARFSLEDINKSPASVDEDKLTWINRKHFRRRLHDPSRLAELARELAHHVKTGLGIYRVPPESETLTTKYLSSVLQILEDRVCLIPRVPVESPYFWRAPTVTRDTIPSPDNAVTVLEAVVERLSTLHEFSERSLTEELKAVSSTLHITHKSTVRIFRASVIGLESSPGVSGICCVLGRQEVLRRLRQTILTLR